MPSRTSASVAACLLASTLGCSPAPPAPPPAASAAQESATAPPIATVSTPEPAVRSAVAGTMAKAALIKAGDKVLVAGSVRDNALLEDLAIASMKAGGQPLVAVGSERLARRSFDEVPASYDTLPPALDLALVQAFDVQLSVDTGESEGAMAGVPAERMAARAQASEPATAAFLKRGVRSVNLGNGLYPTAVTAARLNKTPAELAAIFWKAAAVPPESLREKGEALRAVVSAGKQVTLSTAAGTKVSFSVLGANAMVSDGAITPERVKQGGVSTQTWLPAGELLIPVAPGTADGTVVIEKLVFRGTVIEGLTLAFSKGTLTSMTAKSGLGELKALYDASTGGKDQFGYIDLGLNPEATLPTNTGHIVWMAPGAVTVGVGDNRGWGGSNASTFSLAAQVAGATLAVDGKTIIENGVLK